MAIEAVIFDYGGVFITSPVVGFARFERENGLPEKFIGGVIKNNLNEGAFAKFERSEIDFARFDIEFAKETRDAGFEISGKTFLSLLHGSQFHENMVAAFEACKAAGLKTGCITNNLPLDALDWGVEKDTARHQQIFASFDYVIESAKAGVRKPEPVIYEMICDALSVQPEFCVFLDDLGVNLKPAKAMGMKTIKVPLDDVQPAIDELVALTNIKV